MDVFFLPLNVEGVGKTSDISLQAEGVAEARRMRTGAQASLSNAL
jgi:hypothetical protein